MLLLRARDSFAVFPVSRAAAETHAALERFRRSLPPAPETLSADVRALLQGIHRDLFSPSLCVKTLKERCGLHDNNISSRFKAATGIYLSAYISSLRIAAARLLLRRRDMSATEVATRVGFANVQTFYRVFRVVLGCTPGVYRREPT
jgi:AraC family transcriptional regulator, transcriptional activator FtrA